MATGITTYQCPADKAYDVFEHRRDGVIKVALRP